VPASGLSHEEARQRLAREGPNELSSDRAPSALATVWRIVREPMLLLLLTAGGAYVVLGDVAEALTLLFFVFVIIGIEVVQEQKTERALSALKDLTSPRALVIRSGERLRIPGREVVRGDLLILAEGDRVPADARLVDAQILEVDESLLTGEAVPVQKRVGAAHEAGPAGTHTSASVFAGTLLVRGRGVAEVTATGLHSEIGRIGAALSNLETEPSPLAREVSRVVRIVAFAGLFACALLVTVYTLTRGDFVGGLLAGIALAMAVLPEEFPVVLSVFMALGAMRLSKHRVLTRRAKTIETLGAATVLCTDKTGTLTENVMRIAQLDDGRKSFDVRGGELPEDVHAIVEYGILASAREPFDPMEVAFRRLGSHALSGTEHLHDSCELVREYPLSPELLSMAQVWRAEDGRTLLIAAKGAPEAIFDLCHLPPAEVEAQSARVRSMAERGLRVLGVARATFDGSKLPPEQHDFAFELLGLVGLEDPLREKAAAAVLACREAGLRVMMITGDYPETARAIAAQAGLDPEGAMLTGPELTKLDDAALKHRLRHVRVVARAVPEHKLRIVQALSASGEIVAMTGDGVNDAPALKAAHIGIAMGGRGTDVAREAAALVVTDDDFASIVDGVRLGRRIFDNLQKAMAYILAIHVPIAGMSLVPVLLGLPLALSPVHIVFLELMIDPVCSIAFEAEPAEPNLMRRPPRKPGARLFSAHLLVLSLLEGLTLLAATLGVYLSSMSLGEDTARALAFASLIAGNISLIFVNRSFAESALASLRVPNLTAWLVSVVASVVLASALTLPFMRELFRFGAVPALPLLWALAAGAGSLLWVELVKWRAPSWLRT
jgi:Ca2+-transporting ATPase